jgi:hypothetical protein
MPQVSAPSHHGPLQGCCENCWDSDGKKRGIAGNHGEGLIEAISKKIREVAAFSKRCHSPGYWIVAPVVVGSNLIAHLPAPNNPNKIKDRSEKFLVLIGDDWVFLVLV